MASVRRAATAVGWPLDRGHAQDLLFDAHPLPSRDEHGRWDTLDEDLVLRHPGLRIFEVADQPGAFAGFVGLESALAPRRVGRDPERHLFLYWGLLKRTPEGAIALGELTVAPLKPDALTSTMLRSLRHDRIVDRARKVMRDEADWIDVARDLDPEGDHWQLPPPDEIERIKRLGQLATRSRRRRGRVGNPPEFYRAFALEALGLQRELGITRGLRGELAKRRHVEVGTIRDWIRRSRDLGFLDEAEWGKAGLRPGPKLAEAVS